MDSDNDGSLSTVGPGLSAEPPSPAPLVSRWGRLDAIKTPAKIFMLRRWDGPCIFLNPLGWWRCLPWKSLEASPFKSTLDIEAESESASHAGCCRTKISQPSFEDTWIELAAVHFKIKTHRSRECSWHPKYSKVVKQCWQLKLWNNPSSQFQILKALFKAVSQGCFWVRVAPRCAPLISIADNFHSHSCRGSCKAMNLQL